jgi:hypothetical protein
MTENQKFITFRIMNWLNNEAFKFENARFFWMAIYITS